jgi:hypothetical protein
VYSCDACDTGLCMECSQDHYTKLNF